MSASRRSARSGTGRAGLVLGVLILVAVAALAGFVFSRPAHARVVATPSDAVIRLEHAASSDASVAAIDTAAGVALLTAKGSLEATSLSPGAYRARVSRRGFATQTVTFEVKRFGANARRVSLKALPQKVIVKAKPEGATIALIAEGEGNPDGNSGGKRLSGTTRLTGALPSGRITVTCSRAGCNAYKRTFYLDRPLTLEVFLDPKGQQVHSVGTITTAGAPKGVVVRPGSNEGWATILNGPPSVEIFDLKTLRKTGEVDIGKYGAVEIEFTADGKRAYASQMETAKVFEIDASSRKVTRSFGTESAWTKVVELSPDEKTLYAANWSGDDVSEIDLVTGKLRRRIRVADTPRGLYATRDGRSLYVAGFGAGDLERIDLATGKVKKLFKSGGALRHLVADERTARLYASDMAKDCVYVCNMKTGAVKRFIGVDEKPNTIDLSPDGRVLFVSCRGENNAKSYYIPGPEWGTVLLFDALDGKPLDAVVGGNQCTALDVSDDGKTLVFSDFLDNRLRVYQVPTYDSLVEGGGGRYQAHFADLKK